MRPILLNFCIFLSSPNTTFICLHPEQGPLIGQMYTDVKSFPSWLFEPAQINQYEFFSF